jgi:hypothetical protein
MRLLIAGFAYFSLVFGAGFVLAPLRLLWLLPRVGERAAELIELPLMLVVAALAAKWVLGRFCRGCRSGRRIAIGAIALSLMLVAEFGLVLPLRGLGPLEYLATRDPVSGTAYYLALLLFALMPWLLGRPRRTRAQRPSARP